MAMATGRCDLLGLIAANFLGADLSTLGQAQTDQRF
jgi:hypothetical protein